MRRCDFCGDWFEELRFQIVVPELRLSLHSVECALAVLEEPRGAQTKQIRTLAIRALAG